jgi:lipoprotein-releasing system permease protein
VSPLGAFYLIAAPPLLALQVWLALSNGSLISFGPADAKTALGFAMRVAAVVLPLACLSALALAKAWERSFNTAGRTRLMVGASAGLINTAAWSAIVAPMLTVEPSYLAGLGIRASLPHSLQTAISMALGLAIACGLAILVCSITAWFLISKRWRERIWYGVDALLLIAVSAAFAFLPTRPHSADPNALTLPLLKHAITTLAVLRLVIRLVPRLLDLIERIHYQPLVAARHLRSRKSGFLAAISVLSILAVTVSCCALTTTLSVMGGFRSDLKRKILGNNAHIVIDRERQAIDPWTKLLADARAVPGVSGASPYVTGEVMLASASNFASAVLRGIDPQSVREVSDLAKNMRAGKLDYLQHPELAVDSQPAIWPVQKRAAMAPSQAPPTLPSDDISAQPLNRRRAPLDPYLLDDAERAQKASESDRREKVPGIILGQELASALRLFTGDEVQVISPLGGLGPSGPIPKSRNFRVVGIFYSGMYEYDAKHAYAELGTTQRFLNTGEGINGIEIKVPDLEKAPIVAARLRKSLGHYALRIQDWQQLNSRLFGALELEKLAMFLVLGIAVLVASFCIAGTLTLMVQEKAREVAVLKAMGSSDSAIVAVFIIEGALIGALGATLGLFLGYMACFGAEHLGIRMDPEVYYIDRLPVHIDGVEFALVALASIVVCLLVTVYPALLASKVRPVEALRYE